MFPRRSLLRDRQGGRARACFNLVVPLGGEAAPTAMRTTDTAAQPDLFGDGGASGAVSPVSDRRGDVDRTMIRRTPMIPAGPGTSRSSTATRTTTSRRTAIGSLPSADRNGAEFSFRELLAAHLDCRQHKRSSRSCQDCEIRLEHNLVALYEELATGAYRPGPSIVFALTRPKPREVWAAGYRDRIVHHLLYNRIGPRFERTFIADSCACMSGRGTLYAAHRLEAKVRAATQNWSRRAWYLKCDLASFFVRIDKRILWNLLAPRIHEPWWHALAELVLVHDPRPGAEIHGARELLARVPAGKSLLHQPAHLGLPIGNLSSQFFANVYLDQLDQFVKHQLRVRHYVRYVDDIVLLHESPQQLNAWRAEIDAFLPQALHAGLNPAKTILQQIERGIDFVGHVLKPWRRTIRRRTFNDALQRIAGMDAEDVHVAANSYFGLLRQASHSHRDRARLANVVRRRGLAVDHKLRKAYP